jgi:hypothetical protein
MSIIGRNTHELFDKMLNIVKEQLGELIATAASIRIVIDDTPTK